MDAASRSTNGTRNNRRRVATTAAAAHATTSSAAYDGGKRSTMALLSRVKLETSANTGSVGGTHTGAIVVERRPPARTATQASLPKQGRPSLTSSLRDEDLRSYLTNDDITTTKCDDAYGVPLFLSPTPEGVAGMPDWMRRQYLEAQRREHRRHQAELSAASPPHEAQDMRFARPSDAIEGEQARQRPSSAQLVDGSRVRIAVGEPQRASSSLSVHTMGFAQEEGTARERTRGAPTTTTSAVAAAPAPARPVKLRSEVYRTREDNSNDQRSGSGGVGQGRMAPPRCSSATFSFAPLPEDRSDAARHDCSPAIVGLLHRVASARRAALLAAAQEGLPSPSVPTVGPQVSMGDVDNVSSDPAHPATATTVVPRVLRNRSTQQPAGGNRSPPHKAFETFVVEDPRCYNPSAVFSHVRPLSAASMTTPRKVDNNAIDVQLPLTPLSETTSRNNRTRSESPSRSGCRAASPPPLPRATASPHTAATTPPAVALPPVSPSQRVVGCHGFVASLGTGAGTGVQLLDTTPLEAIRHHCEDDDPLLVRMRRQSLGPVDAVEALLQRVHAASGSVKRGRTDHQQQPALEATRAVLPDDGRSPVAAPRPASSRTSPHRLQRNVTSASSNRGAVQPHHQAAAVGSGGGKMPPEQLLQGNALHPATRPHRQTSPTTPALGATGGDWAHHPKRSPGSAAFDPGDTAQHATGGAVTVPGPGSITPPFSVFGTPPVSSMPTDDNDFNDDEVDASTPSAPALRPRASDGSSLPSSSHNPSPLCQAMPRQHVPHAKMQLLQLPSTPPVATSTPLEAVTPRGADGGHSARRPSIQRSPRLSLSVAGGTDALLATPRGSIVEQLMTLSARRESAAAERAKQPPPPLVPPSGQLYAKTTLGRLAMVVAPEMAMRGVSTDALQQQQVAAWQRANRPAGSDSLDAVVADIERELQSIGAPVPDVARHMAAATASRCADVSLSDAAPALYQLLSVPPVEVCIAHPTTKRLADATEGLMLLRQEDNGSASVTRDEVVAPATSVPHTSVGASAIGAAAAPCPRSDDDGNATLVETAGSIGGATAAADATSHTAHAMHGEMADGIAGGIGYSGHAAQEEPLDRAAILTTASGAMGLASSMSAASLHLSVDEGSSGGSGALMRSTTMPYVEATAVQPPHHPNGGRAAPNGVVPPSEEGGLVQHEQQHTTIPTMMVVVDDAPRIAAASVAAASPPQRPEESVVPSFDILLTAPSALFTPPRPDDSEEQEDAVVDNGVVIAEQRHRFDAVVVEVPLAVPAAAPGPSTATVSVAPGATPPETPALISKASAHSSSQPTPVSPSPTQSHLPQVPPSASPVVSQEASGSANGNGSATTSATSTPSTTPPVHTTLLPPLKLRTGALPSPPEPNIIPATAATAGDGGSIASQRRRSSASAAPSKSPRRTSAGGGGGVSSRAAAKEQATSATTSPPGALLLPETAGGAPSRTPRGTTTKSPVHAAGGAKQKGATKQPSRTVAVSKSPRPQSAPKSDVSASREVTSDDIVVTPPPRAVSPVKVRAKASAARPSSAPHAAQPDANSPSSTPSASPQQLSLDGDVVVAAPPALQVVETGDADDGAEQPTRAAGESPRAQSKKKAQQLRPGSGSGSKAAPLKSPRGALREPAGASGGTSRSRTPRRQLPSAESAADSATVGSETPPAAAASLLSVDTGAVASASSPTVSPRKGNNAKKGAKSPRGPPRGTRGGGAGRGKPSSTAEGRSKEEDDEDRLEDDNTLKVDLMSDSDAEDGDDLSGPLQNSLDPVASILVTARTQAQCTPEERETKLRLRRSVIKHLATVLQQDLRRAAMSVLAKQGLGHNSKHAGMGLGEPPLAKDGVVAPVSPAGSNASLAGWGGGLLSDNETQSVRSAASPLLNTTASSTAKSPRGGSSAHGGGSERPEFLTRAPPKIRIAVVISIATYKDSAIPKNMQCEHEASAVASVLSSIGFVVTRMTMFSNQEELRPTSREAVLKCIQLATKGCKVATDFVSIVYACGGGFSGALPGSNATNNPQPVTLRHAPGKLVEQLGAGAAFVLVPGNIPVTGITREAVLTLSDLMHIPSSTDGTHNWVVMDAYSASFLPPCPQNLNGFGMVGGRKTIGGELFCLYEMQHLLPLSLYLLRALSGWATRDSRLSVNGINAYVHGHLARRGLFATTSASPFFVGDLDLATVHELRFCRQEIRDIRNVLHGKYATVALTLVPTRNQDPTSAEFVRQLQSAFVELLSSDADNPIVKCLHRTYAHKLIVTMRGINPVKLLGDDTATFRHSQAATVELRERLNDPSVEYRATCVGQLLLGEITISHVLAREEFLLKFENSKRIRAVKALKKAWLQSVQDAREKRQLAMQQQQQALQQLESLTTARRSLDAGGGGGSDTTVLLEAVPRRTSSGDSTPAETTLIGAAVVVAADGGGDGKSPRPLAVTTSGTAQPTPPPTPTGLLGVQRRASGGKAGEASEAFTPRVIMTSTNAFNINAAIEQAAQQQAKPDVSRAAGHYCNPIDKGFQLDGKAVHEIGLVTCITFLTTEYLALKLDRAIRSHGLLSHDYLLKDVKISPMDSDHVQLHRIVAGFQAMWRGKQTRKKMATLFPLLRDEVARRGKVVKEERDFVLKINAALVWSAQRIAIDAERTARGDVQDLEHQALTYLYMDRVSLYQRIAYQWFVSIAVKLEATENVMRQEIVHRKNILWPAMLHFIFLRRFIRILRDEDKARVKMVDQAENKIRNIGSQFWKVERKRW